MFPPESIILLISFTILVGYISSLIYSKTKIPDIVWLLGLGILIGPIFKIFDKKFFLELSPLMSIIALCVILFDAGINIDIDTLMQTIVKSTSLAVATFLSTVILVGFILNTIMPASFTLLQAMLLGSMIGGTSTVSVYGILSGLNHSIKNIDSSRIILLTESIITDPICIISSLTIIRMMMMPVALNESFRDIFSIFSLSSLLGFLIGFIWAGIMDRLRGRPFLYMITLAIIFPSYLIAESAIGEGGGALTALTFGLAITNYRSIAKKMGFDATVKIDKRKLREFHDEITFFMKSFFFVYIGLLVTLSVNYFLVGITIGLIILGIRYLVATSIGNILDFSVEEKILTRLICASGLPAFIMSQLPIIYDPNKIFFANPEIYSNLCMPIVLTTVIYASTATPLIAKRQLQRRDT